MQGLLAAVAALALFALCKAWSSAVPLDHQTADSVGVNFMMYRAAVQTYYSANPGAGPVVATASLSLAAGYRAAVPWQNIRGSASAVFVYGPAGAVALAALLDEYGGQLGSVGVVRGGRLLSPIYGDLGVSVPVTIADGSLAGIVQAN